MDPAASVGRTDRKPLGGDRRTIMLAVVALVAAALYVALCVYTSPAFRGSDQYWYVEDTQTLIDGGPAETHETYPYFELVSDEGFEDSRPFIHNVPVLRVWALAGQMLGDVHWGIMMVNIACGLLTALFTYLAVRVFASRTAGILAAAFTLFVPVGFWVTSQAMAEPFSGTLIALATWLVLRFPRRIAAYLVSAIVVALAAAGRIWALAFLPALAFGVVALDGTGRKPIRWLKAAAIAVLGLAAYVPLSHYFVNFMPPLDPMALLEVSRTNNMVMYYKTTAAPPFDLAEFARGIAQNAKAAIIAQFSPVARVFPISTTLLAADRFPIDIAALVAAAGLVRRTGDRARDYSMLLGLVAFAMHLIMAVLYLNHPRYIVVALAPLAIGAAAALDTWWSNAPSRSAWRVVILVLVGAALLGGIGVDVRNARWYRADALAHEAAREETVALIADTVPEGARVVTDTRFASHWVADFALYPRPTLVLATEFAYDDDTYRRLVADFSAEYVVADDTSVLPELLDLQQLDSTGRYRLYSVAGVNP